MAAHRSTAASGLARSGASGAAPRRLEHNPRLAWRNAILDYLRRHGASPRDWIPARWPVTRLVRDRLVEELVQEGTVEVVDGAVRAAPAS